MWILSQNKEVLFECKKAITIEEDEYSDKFLVCGGSGSDAMILGIYSSEAKAKKVLIEIAEQLSNVTSTTGYDGYPDDKFPNSDFKSEVIFKMPGDDE